MQVTETLSEGLKRELKIVIGADELKARLDAKIDQVKDKVKLSGFRPGKVPAAHIKKIYGRSFMAEVVDETVNETTTKAISERNERPAFRPAIKLPEDEGTVTKVIEGKNDLEFTMSFEVLPKFELTDLKTLKVERPVAELPPEELQKAIDRLRENNVVYDTKDSAAEEKDRVTIDFVGKIDGEAFEGGAGEGAQVVIGRGGFIPGFEEGLIGGKAGEERVIRASFPEEYQAKHLAGKDAEFTVKIAEVASPRVPEADDEFAKSLGLESLDKLKDAIRDQYAKEYKQASRQKAKQSLLDALDTAHGFELPPSLVDSEFDQLWKQVTQQLAGAHKKFEDVGVTEDAERQRLKQIAERRVRLGLVLAEIGTVNEITVSDEEVRRAIMQQAQQFPGQERMVVDFYKKNPNALLELRMPLFEDKVVDFALELANVAESTVTPEELFKSAGDDFEAYAGLEPHVHGPDCDHDHDHEHHDHDHHGHKHG
jgi:trigger factor